MYDLCLARNTATLNFTKKSQEKVQQEINDYKIVFDLSLAGKMQAEVDEIMESNDKPEIHPDYTPEPLLTTNEILNKTTTTATNEDFIKTSLVIRDEEIKAENDIANEKTKKIIKDIVNPAPGLFIDNEFIPQQDINTQPNTTDNPYKLKPDVQKQLNETILKKN